MPVDDRPMPVETSSGRDVTDSIQIEQQGQTEQTLAAPQPVRDNPQRYEKLLKRFDNYVLN